jgi:hypothetical protein
MKLGIAAPCQWDVKDDPDQEDESWSTKAYMSGVSTTVDMLEDNEDDE